MDTADPTIIFLMLWAGNGWLVERQKLAFGTLISGWRVFMGGAT